MTARPPLLFLVLLLPAFVAAGAQEVSMDRLGPQDGAVYGAVNDLAQDARGFLWFASRRGVVRFDGRETKSLRALGFADTPEEAVTLRLSAAGADVIWFATTAGGTERLDSRSGTLVHFALRAAEGEAETRAEMIVIDTASIPWVLAEDGRLFVFAPERNRFRPLDAGTAEPANIFALPGGGIGMMDRTGSVSRYSVRDGAPEPLSAESVFTQAYWRDIGRVSAWRKRAWFRLLAPAVLSPRHSGTEWGTLLGAAEIQLGADGVVNDALLDSRGRLWFAPSTGGVFRIDPGARARRVTAGAGDTPQREIVLRLLEDRSGTVWIATTAGMYSVNDFRHPFSGRIFVTGDGAPVENVISLGTDAAGRLWAGTVAQGLLRFPAGAAPGTAVGSRMRDATVLSLLDDGAGGMYCGTADTGILRYDGRGFSPLAPTNQVVQMVRDRRGTIWLAALTSGVGELDPASGAVAFWDPASRRGGAFDASALALDGNGNLWVGADGGGVVKLLPDRRNFLRFSAGGGEQGLTDAHVLSLAEGPDGGIWAGTRSGLNRIDPASGTIRTFTEGSIIPDVTIGAIAADDSGGLWFSTASGLARYRPRDGNVRTWGVDDGVSIIEQTPGVSCRTADGRLLFGGPGGILEVVPAALRNGGEPPPVAFTLFSVISGGHERQLFPGALHDLRLAWEEHGFRFEYAVLDYTAPRRNRLAHRLVGVDSAWVEQEGKGGGRYVGLAPGSYTLHLKGANSDGIWNETGTSLSIEVVAPFWMTWPFRIAVGLGIFGLVAAGVWLRLRAIERQRSALMREVEERKLAELKLLSQQARLRTLASELTLAEERQRRHLARLLHDDIGHALLGSKVKLSTLERMITSDDLKREIHEVSATLEAALQNARTLTTELSPPALYQFGLESAAENLVEHFGREYGIRSSLTLLNNGGISEEVTILLYQSLRELLINILKHAAARSIDVVIDTQGPYIALTVTDDGVGFDPRSVMESDVGAAGFGLFSIRTRLESVGGRLEVESAPGKGTQVRMFAPLDEEHEDMEKP